MNNDDSDRLSRIDGYSDRILIQMVTWDKVNIRKSEFDRAKEILKKRGHKVDKYEYETQSSNNSKLGYLFPLIFFFLWFISFIQSGHGSNFWKSFLIIGTGIMLFLIYKGLTEKSGKQ